MNIPQNNSSNDMMKSFQELQNKNEIAEVLKELFDKGKIYMIGDLSKDEIKIVTRIYMIADMKKIPLWKKGLGFYCQLLLSKDRKSRKEILEAIQGTNNSMNMFQRMNPLNWGRK